MGRWAGAGRRYWLLVPLLIVLALCTICCAGTDPGQEVVQKYGLYPDVATNLRVHLIGQRIGFAAGFTGLSLAVFNQDDLNAFALPDGRVYVTSRMAAITTDDELAFVLGHEVTHIKEGHAKRQVQRATGGALLGALLAAALGGDEGDIRLGADIAGGITYGHYSRKDENRADAGGVRLMTSAGYDPAKAADAMQRLIDAYGAGDASIPVLGWFATHPDSRSRKDRIKNLAVELGKNPPAKTPDPRGIDITLAPSAVHARAWVHDFLAVRLAAYGEGKVVVLPSAQFPAPPPTPKEATPAPPLPVPKPANPPTAPGTKADKDTAKPAPLPAVIVSIPSVPVAYRVTVALRQVPAGHGRTLETSEGTAVEATLHWTEEATGFSGDCVAQAQTREVVPWEAQAQLKDAEALRKLSDGKSLNMEGTLEGVAVRRAAMAFSEILEARGPVEHKAPVTVRLPARLSVRPGDYLYTLRGNHIVTEMRVDEITGGTANVTVLWGTHVWKKGDQFVLSS